MKLVTFDDGKVGRVDGESVVELVDDIVVADAPDLAVVERHELHVRDSSHATTSAAFRSGGNTG